MPDLEILFEAVRAYCRKRIPGDPPVCIRVKLKSGELISHPIPPEAVAVPVTEPSRPAVSHSPDYRSARWHGTDYTFTVKQAAVVRVLWEAWEDGAPEVGCATLLQVAESDAERLRDVFQGHPGWGSCIVPGERRGTYRLSE